MATLDNPRSTLRNTTVHTDVTDENEDTSMRATLLNIEGVEVRNEGTCLKMEERKPQR